MPTRTATDTGSRKLTMGHYVVLQIVAIMAPPAVVLLRPRPDRPHHRDLWRNVVLWLALWIPAVIHASLYLLDEYRISRGRDPHCFQARATTVSTAPSLSAESNHTLHNIERLVEAMMKSPTYRGHQAGCPQCMNCDRCFRQHVLHEASRLRADPASRGTSQPPTGTTTPHQTAENRDVQPSTRPPSVASERSGPADHSQAVPNSIATGRAIPTDHTCARRGSVATERTLPTDHSIARPTSVATDRTTAVPPDHSRQQHRGEGHHVKGCMCRGCIVGHPPGGSGGHVRGCVCHLCDRQPVPTFQRGRYGYDIWTPSRRQPPHYGSRASPAASMYEYPDFEDSVAVAGVVPNAGFYVAN
ncbi:hypothetical protein M011DRAFT_489375 [Sporormia fimetaria CBS 119925]|uniref:Uncharacterized protein n=1 Tax=Sporormia fimetaria CBS 119925 TaxID=1340428 RepID=A0A6A6V285_9PLEO|nr:hypothetical protein M011DRAFT_489375 [Sporormia fimetaria CBS 119925]